MKTTTILIAGAVIAGIYFLTKKDDKTPIKNSNNAGNADNENEIEIGNGNAILDENGAVLIPDSGMQFNITALVMYQGKNYRIIDIDKLKKQYKIRSGMRSMWVDQSSVTAA